MSSELEGDQCWGAALSVLRRSRGSRGRWARALRYKGYWVEYGRTGRGPVGCTSVDLFLRNAFRHYD